MVGRRDDAHIDGNLAPAADTLDHVFLQHAQQLDLQIERQVADLVEKQGAAIGLLEAPLACLHGAGKGALFVTEEFASNSVSGIAAH